MRLATFNVLYGQAPGGHASTEMLVEACGSLNADVLCLQEIDRGQSRSASVDQTAAIAAEMGAEAWRFQPALIGEPGGEWRAAVEADAVDAGAPGYGVGMVSRLPVSGWDVVRLRAAPIKAPVAVPGGKGRFILLPDEPRVALVAQVETPYGSLAIATTHLSFVPGWNVSQLIRLARGLARRESRALIVGDLNIPGPLPHWLSGWKALARAKTYPADEPFMQLDHVLGRGPLPAVVQVATRRLAMSDHRALIVDFEHVR